VHSSRESAFQKTTFPWDCSIIGRLGKQNCLLLNGSGCVMFDQSTEHSAQALTMAEK
jgi:hypothetical protein